MTKQLDAVVVGLLLSCPLYALDVEEALAANLLDPQRQTLRFFIQLEPLLNTIEIDEAVSRVKQEKGLDDFQTARIRPAIVSSLFAAKTQQPREQLVALSRETPDITWHAMPTTSSYAMVIPRSSATRVVGMLDDPQRVGVKIARLWAYNATATAAGVKVVTVTKDGQLKVTDKAKT